MTPVSATPYHTTQAVDRPLTRIPLFTIPHCFTDRSVCPLSCLFSAVTFGLPRLTREYGESVSGTGLLMMTMIVLFIFMLLTIRNSNRDSSSSRLSRSHSDDATDPVKHRRRDEDDDHRGAWRRNGGGGADDVD